MSQQYLNDGDEKETRPRPAEEPEHREAPHEDVAPEEASSRADESVEAVEPMTTNPAPRRQRRNKNGEASEPLSEPQGEAQAADRADADMEESAAMSDDDDLRKLMALGFTHDEATRLIDVSVRITNSNEARDAEATRKRLQFAKWLVEQGVLDEFSLRD